MLLKETNTPLGTNKEAGNEIHINAKNAIYMFTCPPKCRKR